MSAATKKGTNKRSGRLGTQMRGKLQEDYDERGKQKTSLWYVYSPKGRRDFVLHGDLRYAHFLLVESDIAVERVDYKPRERVARIAGEDIAHCIDAELHLQDGTVVWRSVRSSDTVARASQPLANLRLLIETRGHSDLPARLECLTEEEVYAQPLRIQNWNRALPWLAQARSLPLHEHGNDVATLLHTRREVLLGDVMALGEGNQSALYVAALLHGLQFGRIESDLHDRPWSLRSRFFLREAA